MIAVFILVGLSRDCFIFSQIYFDWKLGLCGPQTSGFDFRGTLQPLLMAWCLYL